MRESFSWFVARRYLTAQRRQAFIGLISAFSIAGVAVGVAAVIIALALMTGVQGEMRDRIVGSTAHMFVRKVGTFESWAAERQKVMRPGVIAAAPAVIGAALFRASGSEEQFAYLKGIDPEAEPTVVDLAAAMKTGAIADLIPKGPDDRDGLLLGVDLAEKLGLRVGDLVDVFTASLTPTPMGMRPRSRTLRVVGTFEFGFYEVDTQFGLVLLQTATDLMRKEQWDLIQLKVADLNAAPQLREELDTALGPPYYVQDWTQINASLYSALWLEKVAISLTIGLIVMVAALNIVASLVLLVMEKSRDIAILRTMGAPARVIRRIFIYQGLTIGLVGTLAGTALGLIACTILNRYELIRLPSDVYQITHLRFLVRPIDVLIVVVSAVAVCLLATLYPSRQAGRIDPAEALRNQ